MSDMRWCDLCNESALTRDMVDTCCGSWVCDDCVLREAERIRLKREKKSPDAGEEE